MPVTYSWHLPKPFLRLLILLPLLITILYTTRLLLTNLSGQPLHHPTFDETSLLHAQQQQQVSKDTRPLANNNVGPYPNIQNTNDKIAAADSQNIPKSDSAIPVANAPSNLEGKTSPVVNHLSPPVTPLIDSTPPNYTPKPKPNPNIFQFIDRLNSPPYRLTDPRWDHIVIAVKSGVDVAADRVPIQLTTFLQGVKNIWLFGDGVMNVGDYIMTDVVTGTYDAAVLNLTKSGRLEAANQPSSMKQKFESMNVRTLEQLEEKQRKEEDEKNAKDGRQGLSKRAAIRSNDFPIRVPRSDDSTKGSSQKDKEVVPDQKKRGWIMDANKNIPAVRELVHRYPDAEWYVMIDDDTYVFMENLHRVIHPRDPKQPQYFGAPNTFRDCDGVTKSEDGPLFAHGGSGIVLSRVAALQLVEIADECIVRYNSCFAGDVRLGLCLRDAGILLNFKYPGRRWFNAVTPHWNTYPYYEDPCKRVVSFHHLSKDAMQKLYNIERSVAKKTFQLPESSTEESEKTLKKEAPHLFFPNGTQPSVYSHLQLPLHLPSPYSSPIHLEDMWAHFVDNDPDLPEIETDVMRPGEHYMIYTGAKDPPHCRWMCSREDRCRAWHYSPDGRCEVKNSIPRVVPTKGHSSGLMKNRFRCDLRTL